MPELRLTLRTQTLGRDEDERAVWRVELEPVALPVEHAALLLCDVWNDHTCRGAVERLEAMVPRMNQVVGRLRNRGVTIIHAPSDTIPSYAGHPARRRMIEVPPVAPPADLEHDDPPLPVDSTGGGSDTPNDKPHPPWPWTAEHPGITIDETRDFISADGKEVYSLLRQRNIERMLILGVHTNMCVLRRSFAIKQMTRWGQPMALIRDLTDTMYNPAMSPYVSHDEGTQLVIGYIEKFWCPTVHSDELLRAR